MAKEPSHVSHPAHGHHTKAAEHHEQAIRSYSPAVLIWQAGVAQGIEAA